MSADSFIKVKDYLKACKGQDKLKETKLKRKEYNLKYRASEKGRAATERAKLKRQLKIAAAKANVVSECESAELKPTDVLYWKHFEDYKSQEDSCTTTEEL